MPHARVSIVRLDPHRIDAVLAAAATELPDLVRPLPGLVACATYRTGTVEALTIEEWRTIEEADAGGRVMEDWTRRISGETPTDLELHEGEIAFVHPPEPGAARHVHVGVYGFRPGACDRSIEAARAELLPLLRSRAGFLRHLVARLPHTRLLSVSWWGTREEVAGALAAATGWLQEQARADALTAENHFGELVWSARP